MTRFPRIRSAAAILLIAVAASACGSGIDPNAPSPDDALTLGVTPTLGGLSVEFSKRATNKLNKEAAKRNTYARDTSVFELRDGKQLRGVFEVLRLAPDADPDNLTFRRKLVSLIIGTSKQPTNIGGTAVYQASTNQQIIYVWFEGQFMQVLLVRETVAGSGVAEGVDVNRLLAEALALEPRPGTPA